MSSSLNLKKLTVLASSRRVDFHHGMLPRQNEQAGNGGTSTIGMRVAFPRNGHGENLRDLTDKLIVV